MIEFNKTEFGENLKKARKKAGLSQENLAYALGINPSVVSKYESGKVLPNVEQLYSICYELGIFINELFESPEKIKNKANSKNPFKAKTLYLYYKGVYATNKKINKLKFKIEIVEKQEYIEVNFVDYKTNKVYMKGYMLADTNVAIMVFENYEEASLRLEITKIVINISDNLNSLMMGALSATNGQYVPNERKCIVSKNDVEFSDEMLDMLKVTEVELNQIKEQDAWYMNITNKDDYES